MKTEKLFILFLAIILSNLARGHVDLSTGNFSDSWVDGQIGPDFAGVQIRRTYNSKSTHSGVFGLGWCAFFEVSMDTNTKPPIVNACDNSIKDAHIFKINSGWVWNSGTLRYIFSKEGKLLGVKTKSRSFELSRNALDLIDKIYNPSTGESVNFKYNEAKNIVWVGGLKNPIEYTYQDGTLITVKNVWENKYHYEYDSKYNLTKVIYPDKSTDEFQYETYFGNITKFKSRNGCSETYEYIDRSKTSPKTKVTNSCSKEGVVTNRTPKKDKVRYGSGALSHAPMGVDENGQIKNLWDSGTVFDYFYLHPGNRMPSSVYSSVGNESWIYAYKYGRDGRVIQITKSNSSFKVTRDPSQRITEASKIGGEVLQINYIGASEKIRSLGFKGKGRINVKYFSDGNVARYSSNLPLREQSKVWAYYSEVNEILHPMEILK